jgi:acetolactate synthase I/II/III large subunit
MLNVRAAERLGGHVVAESLQALGAEVVFGVPGVHALPIWEGLHATALPVIGFRQELNSAFAADGLARVTRRPVPVVASTGPGALMTLGALAESARAFVPVLVISSQIEAAAIGAGRGELHELVDQPASFAPLVKSTATAASPVQIPAVLAAAWRLAATPPPGPVYVELPVDVLQAPAGEAVPDLDGAPGPSPGPPADALDRVAARLAAAARPAVIAGGGVVRAGAEPELAALAKRLGAPVATTYTGKGALPERHPLALGSAWSERAYLDLLAGADVVLCVGSWLGPELTDSWRLRLGGDLIQIDAAGERIGLNLPAEGLVGDAKQTLEALLARVGEGQAKDGAAKAADVRRRIARGLLTQNRRLELELPDVIERVLPAGAAAAWDSTILAYVAALYGRVSEPRRFLYPAGSSTLGYALPAALGVAAGGIRALAVVGDGGVQYGLAELATALQHRLDVAVLIVDDGGYGILREYQAAAGFGLHGVDLEQPDWVELAAAYGVPARRSAPERIEGDLRWALETAGPTVVALAARPAMPEPAT